MQSISRQPGRARHRELRVRVAGRDFRHRRQHPAHEGALLLEAAARQRGEPVTVRDLAAEGHAVFVDFTAAWCVSCQVNERLVLQSQSVSKAFERAGVLRVSVVGGGCSGLQYKMDLQDAPANRDFLVESAGVRVVVDPKSALYVTGSELDYIEALNDGGFKVKNPNAATTCSCGESFSA